MGQVRYGSATTTHAVRAAIQRSKALLATLSRELGINPKTVAKWRKRQTVEDLKTGPKEPRSTILTGAEETAGAGVRNSHIKVRKAAEPSLPLLHEQAIWINISRQVWDIRYSAGQFLRVANANRHWVVKCVVVPIHLC